MFVIQNNVFIYFVIVIYMTMLSGDQMVKTFGLWMKSEGSNLILDILCP
jgi:hypothetical protein